MARARVVILGGGPAGVAAAWQLARQRKASVVVVEQRADVGGNAGSFLIDGIPVDYGSHRFHPSCQGNILHDLRDLLGSDFLDRPRHGRIRLHGRWIHFPLQPLDLVLHLPWSFGCGLAGDAVRKLVDPRRRPLESFAAELERGLGATMCRDFYFPYAVKIWGVPPEELSATQARRRVSAGSLPKLLRRVVRMGTGSAGRFFYPRQGFGQISRAIAAAAAEAGADVQLRTTVRSVQLDSPHRVEVERDGTLRVLEAEQVWSTIPVTALTRALTAAAPPEVLAAGAQVSYRAMVLIYLVLGQRQFTPYDAHYFPERDIVLTRLSEPKNYSGRSDPPERTVLCAEVPCALDDAVWRCDDEQLRALVCDALSRCGLPVHAPVLQVVSKRLPAAYPIYRLGYEAPLRQIDDWLASQPGILTFGRQGLFAHDNTHHTLAMAYAAAECLSPNGHFDWGRWRAYRTDFESHVVED